MGLWKRIAQKLSACLAWRAPCLSTILLTIIIYHTFFTLFSRDDYNEATIRTGSHHFSNSSVALNETLNCTDEQQISRESRENVLHIQTDLNQWIRHLLKTSDDTSSIKSERTRCHELDTMAQTCVFEGIICIDVSKKVELQERPKVYIVDDTKSDNEIVPTDDWCNYRSFSSDPRYYSSRHWPLLNNTIVPQHSCMHATYRTLKSIFYDNDTNPNIDNIIPTIKWVSSLALLDVDLIGNDHNTHFAIDLLWILDAWLYQESTSIKKRPGYVNDKVNNNDDSNFLFYPDVKYYIPQTSEVFERFTMRDINRLLFSILLRKDSRKLYPNVTDDDLYQSHMDSYSLLTELGKWNRHMTQPLLHSFSDFQSQLIFHGDILKQQQHDLVCTPRLTTGMKTGFSTAERVCREIRSKAYELFNIQLPPVQYFGQVRFSQPPRSVLILDRHFTRKIANFDQFVYDLSSLLKKYNVNVTSTTTDKVFSAEDYVRVYSSAGVIITPHGGHNMGQMFMRRHSALIELMPVGYTEYSFSLLSEPCKIWYYEFRASISKNDSEKYEKYCGVKTPHMFNPCNEIKSRDLYAEADKILPVVLQALERLGHDTGTWMDNQYG